MKNTLKQPLNFSLPKFNILKKQFVHIKNWVKLFPRMDLVIFLTETYKSGKRLPPLPIFLVRQALQTQLGP